jgi:hypothetical protein
MVVTGFAQANLVELQTDQQWYHQVLVNWRPTSFETFEAASLVRGAVKISLLSG